MEISFFSQILDKLVKQALKKFNLVSREEFDAQLRILHRCQEKLSLLETKLEQYYADNPCSHK